MSDQRLFLLLFFRFMRLPNCFCSCSLVTMICVTSITSSHRSPYRSLSRTALLSADHPAWTTLLPVSHTCLPLTIHSVLAANIHHRLFLYFFPTLMPLALWSYRMDFFRYSRVLLQIPGGSYTFSFLATVLLA